MAFNTNVVAEALGTLSSATGPIRLVLQVVQMRRMKRVEQFVQDVDRRLMRIERKCSEDAFVSLLNRCVISVAIDGSEFKAKVFASILSSAFEDATEGMEAGLFVSLTDRLQVQHVHILKCLKDSDGTDVGRGGDDKPAIGFAFIDSYVRKHCASDVAYATDITTSALYDLTNCGLLHTRMQHESSGKIVTNLNIVGLARMQVYRLSMLGSSYVRHMETAV